MACFIRGTRSSERKSIFTLKKYFGWLEGQHDPIEYLLKCLLLRQVSVVPFVRVPPAEGIVGTVGTIQVHGISSSILISNQRRALLILPLLTPSRFRVLRPNDNLALWWFLFVVFLGNVLQDLVDVVRFIWFLCYCHTVSESKRVLLLLFLLL